MADAIARTLSEESIDGSLTSKLITDSFFIEDTFKEVGITLKLEDLLKVIKYHNEYLLVGEYHRNAREEKELVEWIYSVIPNITQIDTYNYNLNESRIILSDTNFSGASNVSYFSKLIKDGNEINVITRINRQSKSYLDLIISFIDNVKHIVLYSIIKSKYGKKFGFIPQPFIFGKLNLSRQSIKYFFVMDKADEEIGRGISNKIHKTAITPENTQYVRKLLYSFYKGLDTLNRDLDYFYHGDSHVSNVMIKNDKVVLIDFGHSNFQVNGITFLGKFYRYLRGYFSPANKIYLPVQDYIKLLVNLSDSYRKSLTFNDFCKIVNLKENLPQEERFIGYAIYPCLNFFDTITKVNERPEHDSNNFAMLYKFFYLTLMSKDKNLKKLKPYITPAEMKADFGLTEIDDDDDLYNEYFKKYLKYKTKYLNLKKLIN